MHEKSYNPTQSTSRRDFLKKSLLAGTAFTILPAHVLGQSAPSKRVNLAMIGTGRQGVAVNLATFLGMDNVHVIAVCDVDRLRVAYAKRTVDESYGNTDCRTFTDFREVLEIPGLDAVMITTPDHWHAVIALAAMKKGLHVSCEKAMTRYFAEGRALADVARRTGVVPAPEVPVAEERWRSSTRRGRRDQEAPGPLRLTLAFFYD